MTQSKNGGTISTFEFLRSFLMNRLLLITLRVVAGRTEYTVPTVRVSGLPANEITSTISARIAERNSLLGQIQFLSGLIYH